MNKFDTYVQQLKYEVLKEVIKKAYADDLISCYKDIPKKISPGPKPLARCCVYKDRAIIEERITATANLVIVSTAIVEVKNSIIPINITPF